MEYSITSTTLDSHSIFVLLSTMDWYLEVKIQAEDKQYSSCPLIQGDKDHEDPEHIDFSVPRRAQHLHSAWKKHQDAVFWVDIDLAIKKRIDILSSTIECNYPSRCTSSLLYSKSCEIEKWREIVWKAIFVSSTTTKDLIETRSRLDQREWWIGFYSWTTASRQTRSTVLWRSSTWSVLPTRPNQKPKPICDRSGKPECTEDVFVVKRVKRPVPTRSMKKVCTKNLFLQIDRGNPRNWSENIRVKHAHDGTGQPVEAKQLKCTHSGKNNLYLKKIVTLRHSTRTTSSTPCNKRGEHRLQHSRITYILQWNNHMASTFEIWFRRSRTTLSDMHFKVIFNNIDNSILSAKNHKTWLKQLETLNCGELLDVEPKAQCKVCLSYWDVGIVYCTRGHLLRDDTTENKKYIKSVLDLFSIPGYYIRKSRPHGHRYGKKGRITSTIRRESAQEENARRENSWAFTIVSSVMQDSETQWSKWVVLKKCFVRWTIWRTRITHTTLQKKKLNVHRSNWWIRSNFVGSDTMPIRRRADFKEALCTLRRLKNQEDQAYYQNWWQSSSSSW